MSCGLEHAMQAYHAVLASRDKNTSAFLKVHFSIISHNSGIKDFCLPRTLGTSDFSRMVAFPEKMYILFSRRTGVRSRGSWEEAFGNRSAPAVAECLP